METMLEIQNLTTVYPGGKRAVDGLSLAVRAGEIYGFIGHNGAGKSTTIRAVCGVMDFDGGSIRVAGHDVRAQALEAKRRMAYLPDTPEPYPFMTGAQFISLTADVSICRERSLFSSSDMQSKIASPTFFASLPSMSALTAVFIIADEDENSRLCFMPSYATRPIKTAAAAHKSATISFFELFFIGPPPQSKLPYTYNIHILHCFSSNFKDLKLSFPTAKKYRNISLSIQKLLFKLDVQKNTKILLKLNKISSFLW